MALFQWTSKLETGIPSIDKQHRMLVDSINELHDAMRAGTGREKIQEIVNFLALYAVEHFKTEEAIMKKYNFPQFTAHKKIHDDFVKKAGDLQAQIAQGKNATVEVSSFLADWLRKHISGDDKLYSEFFKNNNISVP